MCGRHEYPDFEVGVMKSGLVGRFIYAQRGAELCQNWIAWQGNNWKG